MEKPFKTFEEQVELLKSRKLKIINEKETISWLKSFNYQNIINGFNDPFFVNHKRDNDYLDTANSQMIYDLFKFNRDISLCLISDLHLIEMRLSTAISYKILEFINDRYLGKSSFSNLSESDMKTLFSNAKGKDLCNLKSDLDMSFNQAKNKKYIDQYDSWKDVPVYTLSLVWSFGLLKKIFQFLNKNIQTQIIVLFFGNEYKNFNIDAFIFVMTLFKDLRNMISHNECIYTFPNENYNTNLWVKFSRNITDSKKKYIRKKIKINIYLELGKILGKDFVNNDGIIINKLNILDIAGIIGIFNKNKKIINKVKNKISRLEKHILTPKGFKPCCEAWNYISNKLGCNKK